MVIRTGVETTFTRERTGPAPPFVAKTVRGLHLRYMGDC